MRASETDYSTTVIYKIYCKDTTIKELYVGHTTDYVRRKKSHRKNCNDANTHTKLYTFIREHGGWDNWIMEVISFFSCKDLSEARQKEQEYFTSLGATLNSIEPYPSPEKKLKLKQKVENTICEEKVDNTNTVNETTNNIEENTNVSNETIDTTIYKFHCKECDFKCNKQSNYNTHLHTDKHINTVNQCKPIVKQHICKCGKEYKYRQGLHVHKQKCKGIVTNENTLTNEQLIKKIITQNNEIIDLLVAQLRL